MFLTPNQIADLLRIVNVYSTSFLANAVGTDILTTADKATLRAAGFSTADIDNASTNAAQAFKFGMLSMALGDNASNSMTYEQFKKHIRSGKFFPLNKVEQAALERIKFQIANETRRLTGNMQRDIERKLVVIDQGRAVHSETVLSAAARAIKDRQSVAQLAGELGKLTEQWNRDMGRIADYVLHEAFNEGRVAQVAKGSGKLYFDVYPGACKHCIRLYLSGGLGSEPIIFDVAAIRANGSNVGKKQNEWKATIGPVHPWCRCTATEVPDGMIWDPVTRSFTTPDPQWQRRVQRRSRVNVTVGNETTEI